MIMLRCVIAGVLVTLTLGAAACSDSGGSSPTGPSDPAPPDGAITINVVGINGAQSFSPNPATVPAGRTVVWHNVDSTTHRVVLNDRSLDTGNIAAGRFSAPMTLGAPGPYHCTIHPEMIGTIVNGQ
jgi:plastocyanin